MRCDRALSHTSSVCLETFRSQFAVTLPLVHSKSWDAQMILDMLDWRQIWGWGRPRKGSITRHLRMVREDTGASSEGATCAWMAAADEAVGCTCAFLAMWRSFRRLVCQGCPEPGLRVNDISRILWSQHFLTTQSERPNSRATA
ncbi:uncharacterized protein TNCV_1182941 [Trichonephila clavipes]|nr:uncharacterized protein TNCV_1182941 [Trichonephila clavipes]